ncbi:MAG: hypothetical protein AB1545_05330 [Thermodesulfobacteriota bacterium]
MEIGESFFGVTDGRAVARFKTELLLRFPQNGLRDPIFGDKIAMARLLDRRYILTRQNMEVGTCTVNGNCGKQRST